jgi:phage N-6-adenine-methyltransferase
MPQPAQKPAVSKQDYCTPREFLDAVEKRFGAIRHDLAASADNAVCADYFDEHRSAFDHDWSSLHGVIWCNPPFRDIDPWVKKAAAEANPRTRIVMLVPASVGSNWYADHVEPHALVLPLNPRLSFDGKNSYPKDCLLACYGLGVTGSKVWRWKK